MNSTFIQYIAPADQIIKGSLYDISEVTYSLTYFASPLQLRDNYCEWYAKMVANLSIFRRSSNKH